MNNKETVVLVHGLAGSRLDMWPISRRLGRLGFSINNWGYRSIGKSIESHAARLAELLENIDRESEDKKFHLVTHSMGGIIARTVFEQCTFQHLKHVVMLAPPNRGSHVARKTAPFFGWLTPSLHQLSDAPGSYVNRLSRSIEHNHFKLGIVEAKKDRVIESGCVLLDSNHEFAQVNGHHGVLTWYADTRSLVESFLIHGNFSLAKRREPTLQTETSGESFIS